VSQFTYEPIATLETKEQVCELLKSANEEKSVFHNYDKWRIKSVWLINLIDEIAAGGQFPYNDLVVEVATSRIGDIHNKFLGILVFNAQKFREHDQLIRSGYMPFTPELLRDAYETGKRIQILGETVLGTDAAVILTPKMMHGNLYAMLPNKRTKHFPPQGQPVKIVETAA